jgi:hypothetical protein
MIIIIINMLGQPQSSFLLKLHEALAAVDESASALQQVLLATSVCLHCVCICTPV